MQPVHLVIIGVVMITLATIAAVLILCVRALDHLDDRRYQRFEINYGLTSQDVARAALTTDPTAQRMRREYRRY